MEIIGRVKQQDLLQECLESKRPEFLVVYGRRRVGKTYLIRQYFNDTFSFYATGAPNIKTREQLKIFNESLIQYGANEKTIPVDWFEAFRRLREILESGKVKRDSVSGKLVIFLDELPWMDTARSDFKSALDYFWNSWGSAREDVFLIVCGSATSWIIDNILENTGGLYNRITRQLHLLPFSLGECEQLLKSNRVEMTRRQIMECYMILGGIPYYLNLLDRRLSLSQNIDELLFKENGNLFYEFERLFASLFKKPERHMEIISELAKHRNGTLRATLAQNKKIGDGEPLTKALNELEQSGFIRKYTNYSYKKQGFFFQIIDPFVLFCLGYIEERKFDTWSDYTNSPGYYNWCGNAFEITCLNHVEQIKSKLGILGVASQQYAWISKESEPGARIDLLIDRRDGIINVCEMKYTMQEYEIDAEYEKKLVNKLEAFRKEAAPDKALHLTLVSAQGLKKGAYSGGVQRIITADDLFQCL